MKCIYQTRALLLSCCLLVLARWSAAQVVLLTETNRSTRAAAPGSEGLVSEPTPQPTKEQPAQQLPDHQPPDNMPCLRDGRTLQCVP
jgi:hypothetical protein